jgi:hemolysin activation/secretion protein
MRLDIKHFYVMKRRVGEWVNKQATEIKWNNYFTLSPRLVLMSSLNGKQIQNRDLEPYELYTLGGTDDLRGFREDQFSGYRIGWSNLELRYLLARKSRVFLFADYGVVQQQLEEATDTLKDLFGIGFGIRLDTRIGLIGVDYGVSHSNGEWLHPLDGMIHFGLQTSL